MNLTIRHPVYLLNYLCVMLSLLLLRRRGVNASRRQLLECTNDDRAPLIDFIRAW